MAETIVEEDNLPAADTEKKLCETCEESKKVCFASKYCEQCKEYLCEDCVITHKSMKATKSHTLLTEEEKRLKNIIICEPCNESGAIVEAIMYCEVCDEYLCGTCIKTHRLIKATRSHTPITVEEKQMRELVKCEPCHGKGEMVEAVNFCHSCEEYLCVDCTDVHNRMKITKNHVTVPKESVKMSQIQSESTDGIKPQTFCEPCTAVDKRVVAFLKCEDCNENMCKQCSDQHRLQKMSREHKLVEINTSATDKSAMVTGSTEAEGEYCSPCKVLKNDPPVSVVYCHECEEFLCTDCQERHAASKALKTHTLLSAEEGKAHTRRLCTPCQARGINAAAMALCVNCENELLCEFCMTYHQNNKITKDHELQTDFERKEQKVKTEEGAKLQTTADEKDTETQIAPGKPEARQVGSDSLSLIWTKPKRFGPKDYFQVSYKEVNGRWKVKNDEYPTATADLTDMKANTTYVFRVRVVYQDSEGPYSDESKDVHTKVSPAERLVPFSTCASKGNPSPTVYTVPFTELSAARNVSAKTRKIEIGSKGSRDCGEKTIMLVGATGTGKSTLVDGIINYVLGVNWSDPFRFRVIDLEEEEKQRQQNQALSQTEWITCYNISPEIGSRLNYRLNIIDTPGFGDTRGLARDNGIVTQIKELFSANDAKGVAMIDAVCFLAKAPDARLTAVQKYIFQSVMSLFGKDIEKNICSLITFADGQSPPVLAALKESGLPFGKSFTFNNSGLFADNSDQSSLAPIFWNMGVQSFRSFFKHIEGLQTRSLRLTKDVLRDRFRIEAVKNNLQPNLDAALAKVQQLKQEIKIFEENKSEIQRNKDFEYEVTETRHKKTELPKGQHVTNCSHCNFTCHHNCAYANDDEKRNCCAMGSDGNCQVCPEKCYWQEHANTPYIFEFVEVKVTKTYADKLQKYKTAEGKIPSQQQLLEQMGEELNEMMEAIEEMMEIIKDCNERLQQMALRPNPLSMVEHIDLMVQSEEMEKKDGFKERIKTLEEFRRRAEIGKHVERVTSEVNSALSAAGKKKPDTVSVFRKMKSLFGY